MLQKKKSVSKDKSFILWFEELGNTDVAYVGGKNASLGEMYRLLSKKGIRIPNGFAITSYAYRYVIKNAGIREEIKKILGQMNIHDTKSLAAAGSRIRKLIQKANMEFHPDLSGQTL